jgi:Holliday junction resolvase RusA-like endonuclease
MQITIPGLPPTTNHLFLTRGRFRVLTPEARQYKEMVEKLVMDLQLEPPEGRLQVAIRLHSSRWLLKDQIRIRKMDIQNREKAVIDSIFKALGVDDSNIWLISLEKVVDVEEKTEVTILSL